MPDTTAASPAQEGRFDVIGLAQLLSALRSRLRLILGVALVAGLLAAVFVTLATPRFASETQILLESREGGFTRTLTERELQGGVFDEQAVASQVQVISSRDVAREAIRRLGLVGNAEFDPLAGPMDPIARVQMMLGGARGGFDAAEEDRIFKNYYARLTVFPITRSRVIAIRFDSADPELAARAANTIAEVYLEQLEAAKTDTARAASSWLGTSIEELRERVSTAEAAVEEFRARSGLLVGGNNATITSQQLSDINTQLAQARSAQSDSQARARLISDMISGGRAFEIPDVANNDLIQRLTEQRIALRSQMALEQRTLLPAHPRILELRAQLNDLDGQITAAAERTVRILENDARLAGARVESLEAALEAQMRVAAQANENEVRLRAFEREARAEREQLEAYLARYREAVARGSGNATLPDARVVSHAVVAQEPSFPRKGPTILLVTLAAVFLTAGWVIVGELAFGEALRPGRALTAQAATQRSDEEEWREDDQTEAAVQAPAGNAGKPERRTWFARFRRWRTGRDAALRETDIDMRDPADEMDQHVAALGAAFDEHRLRGTFDPSNDFRHRAAHAATPASALREGDEVEAPLDDHAPELEISHDVAQGAGVRPDDGHMDDLPQTPAAIQRQEAGVEGDEATQEVAEREDFRFDDLIARLSLIPVEDRGRRVLITGIGDPQRVYELARDFARSVSRTKRIIIVDAQNWDGGDRALGLTDLIADKASFFNVIQRESESRLHRIGFGSLDASVIEDEPQALEISLAAFDQTYEWVVFVMPQRPEESALEAFAVRIDSVVLASDLDPDSPKVVALYEAARRAGAPQVVVACVGELAEAVAA
jgi:uncharacterized protein involved in exopolysaccharide biosynthesis